MLIGNCSWYQQLLLRHILLQSHIIIFITLMMRWKMQWPPFPRGCLLQLGIRDNVVEGIQSCIVHVEMGTIKIHQGTHENCIYSCRDQLAIARISCVCAGRYTLLPSKTLMLYRLCLEDWRRSRAWFLKNRRRICTTCAQNVVSSGSSNNAGVSGLIFNNSYI